MAPRETTGGAYYASTAWVARYMLDWGLCGTEVTTIRAYTTIIRWFDDPQIRRNQFAASAFYRDFHQQPLHWQLELNLIDLMDHDTPIPVSMDRGKLGRFFASLDDGDIITGGPVPSWMPRILVITRPGFAYLLGKWRVWFKDIAPPWGFWVFPHIGVVAVD